MLFAMKFIHPLQSYAYAKWALLLEMDGNLITKCECLKFFVFNKNL